MTRILAIDSGRKGALVVLEGHGAETKALWQIQTSTLCPGDYNPEVMAGAVREVVAIYGLEWAVLEVQGARPGEGRTACFTTGLGFGLWRGILAALRVPVIEANPQVWVPAILGDIPLVGKKRAIFRAKQIPGLVLKPDGKRVAQDGIADAACVGLWAARQVQP